MEIDFSIKLISIKISEIFLLFRYLQNDKKKPNSDVK